MASKRGSEVTIGSLDVKEYECDEDDYAARRASRDNEPNLSVTKRRSLRESPWNPRTSLLGKTRRNSARAAAQDSRNRRASTESGFSLKSVASTAEGETTGASYVSTRTSVSEEPKSLQHAFFDNAESALSEEKLDLAVEMYSKALNLQRKELGPMHQDCAVTLSKMADIARSRSEYGTSIKLYEKSLKSYLANLGPYHIKVGVLCSDIAGVYDALQRHDESIQHYQLATSVFRHAHGELHPDVASCYNNLAMAHHAKGDFKKTVEYFGKALAIRIKLLGDTHSDVADTFSNMAVAYVQQGANELAMKCHSSALAIRIQNFGEAHEDVASSYHNMAVVYDVTQQLESAAEFYTKALTLRRQVLGETHEAVADTFFNLACVLKSLDRNLEARSHFTAAYRIFRVRHGDQSSTTLKAKRGVQSLVSKTHEGRAGRVMRQSLILGNGDGPTASTASASLAGSHFASGIFSNNQSKSLQDQMTLSPSEIDTSLSKESSSETKHFQLPSSSALFQEDDVGVVALDLAKRIYAQGHYEVAGDLFKLALKVLEKVHGSGHLCVADCHHGVGTSYKGWAISLSGPNVIKQYEIAINHLEKAAKIFEKRQDEAKERSIFCHQEVAIIFTLMAKHVRLPNEVDRCEGKVLEYYSSATGAFKKAIEVAEIVLEPGSAILGTLYQSLAESLCDMRGADNWAAAITYLKKALTIRETLGDGDASFMCTLRTLVKTCQLMEDYHAGVEFAARLLEVQSNREDASPDEQASDLVVVGMLHEGTYQTLTKRSRLVKSELDNLLDEALRLYCEARDIGIEGNDTDMPPLEPFLGIARIHGIRGKFDDAIGICEDALKARLPAPGTKRSDIGTLYHLLGDLWHKKEDMETARDMFERALAIRTDADYGPKNWDTAATHKALAVLLVELMDHQEAKKHALSALTVFSHCCGGQHPQVADMYELLGRIYTETNDNALAVDFCNKCLTMRVEIYGTEHETVLLATLALARARWALGKYEDARHSYERAIASGRAVLRDHPFLAKVHSELGSLFLQMANPRLAIVCFLRAEAMIIATCGPSHPDTLDIRRNLASALFEHGQPDLAMEIYNDVYQIGCQISGEMQLDNMLVTVCIADIHSHEKRYDDALKIYTEALKKLKLYLGEGHLEVGNVLHRIAANFRALRQYDMSLEYYNKALYNKRKALGETNLDVASCHEDTADTFYEALNYECALEYHENALEIKLTLQGGEHLNTSMSKIKIAKTYRAMKEYGKAGQLFNEVAKFRQRILGKDSLSAAEAIFESAEMFFELAHAAPDDKSTSQAIEQYNKVLAVKLKYAVGNMDSIVLVHRRLAALFKLQKKADLALAHCKMALENALRIGDHEQLHQTYDSLASVYEDLLRFNKDAIHQAVKNREESLKLRRSQLGDQHPDLAANYCLLAETYSKAGNLNLALEHFKKACNISEGVFGAEGFEMQDVYYRMGKVYHEHQKYTLAVEHFQKALDMAFVRWGENDSRTADGIGQLAKSQAFLPGQLGARATVLGLFERAISIKKFVYHNMHEDIADLYGDIGEFHMRHKEFDSAMKNYNTALSISQVNARVNPGEYTNDRLKHFTSELCSVYEAKAVHAREQRDFKKAIEFSNSSLQMRINDVGSDDPRLPALHRLQGAIYSEQGREDDALRCFGQSVVVARQIFGEEGADLLDTYSEMGLHYMRSANYDFAQHYYNKVLTMRRRLFGWRHVDNVKTIKLCSNVIRRQLYKADNLQALRWLFLMACFLQSCECYVMAFQIYGKIKLVCRKLLEPNERINFEEAVDHALEGVYLLTQDQPATTQFAEAITHYQEVLAALRVVFGDSDFLTTEVEAWLEELVNLMKTAAQSNWTDWKVIPDATLRDLENSMSAINEYATQLVKPDATKDGTAPDRDALLNSLFPHVRAQLAAAGADLDWFFHRLRENGSETVSRPEFTFVIRKVLRITPSMFSDCRLHAFAEIMASDEDSDGRDLIRIEDLHFAVDSLGQVGGGNLGNGKKVPPRSKNAAAKLPRRKSNQKKEIHSKLKKKLVGLDGDLTGAEKLQDTSLSKWCHQKDINTIALWRILDRTNTMQLRRSDFMKGLQAAAMKHDEDAEQLWLLLDPDRIGLAPFYEYDPETAASLAGFMCWTQFRFGSMKQVLGKVISSNGAEANVLAGDLIDYCIRKGCPSYLTDSLEMFLAYRKDGTQTSLVQLEDVTCLDLWKPPSYNWEEPDEKAKAAFKELLLKQNHGNSLTAWRAAIDLKATMRVSFDDFIYACSQLSQNGTLDAVFCDGLLSPLFRAFDTDMSGWLTLRDWDERLGSNLVHFQSWVREEFGGFSNFLRAREDTPDAGVSLHAFANCAEDIGMNRDSLETIFEGLCMKPKRKTALAMLTMEDVQFLDTWHLDDELLMTTLESF